MPIIKKLTKHGNSYFLIIDKAVLDLIGIDKAIEISTSDGKSLSKH